MNATLVRNMLISAILLAGFGGVGTGLVVATFEATKEQIEASEKANLLKNLNNILPPDSYTNDLLDSTLVVPEDSLLGNKGPTTIYQANYNGKSVAVAFPIVTPDGYSGDIRLLIAIKISGEISGVRVISHKETPGLGDKIELDKDDWILNFNGKALGNPDSKLWQVKKDGGFFDQFTGATITPRAVVRAVHRALDYYDSNKNKIFLNQAQYDQLYGNKRGKKP